MAIHVQDEETDHLVRDFARRRGLGITAAIKTAILEASERDVGAGEALAQKIEPLLREVRKRKSATSASAADDKAFMDEMWGEQ